MNSMSHNDKNKCDCKNISLVLSQRHKTMVVVVSTLRSENSTKRSQLFTQFAVVSTFYTSRGDIYSQWEIVKK